MRIDVSQKKTLLGVAAAVALFLGALWYPAYRDIQSLKAQIAAAQAEALGNQGRTSGLKALVREVQSMEHEIRSARRVIPQEGELAELLRGLSTQVTDMQLTEPSISTRPTVEGQGYHVLPVEVSFRGDGRSAFGFIHRIENLPRLVQLTGLRMHLDRETQRLDAQVELNTFYYAAREDAR